jgi:hypothetical protein
MNTTGKQHSLMEVFKFVGNDEYIQSILVGSKTDKYKLVFVGFYRSSTNIQSVGFAFDQTTIFIGEATSLMNIRVLYLSVGRKPDDI